MSSYKIECKRCRHRLSSRAFYPSWIRMRHFVCKQCARAKRAEAIQVSSSTASVSPVVEQNPRRYVCSRCDEKKRMTEFRRNMGKLNRKQRICLHCERELSRQRHDHSRSRLKHTDFSIHVAENAVVLNGVKGYWWFIHGRHGGVANGWVPGTRSDSQQAAARAVERLVYISGSPNPCEVPIGAIDYIPIERAFA